jgi:hypothetical protein
MEATKWPKPSDSGHELVTARACRPHVMRRMRVELAKGTTDANCGETVGVG